MAPVTFGGDRLIKRAALVGGLGVLVTALGIALEPRRALLGYLAAYVAVAAIAFGALVMLMIGYVANARWPAAIRRLQETLVLGFPALVVLFLPIAIGLPAIYSWAGGDIPEADRHYVDAKRAYLNIPFFLVRSAIYLGVCTAAAELLRRWSRARDSAAGAAPLDRERRFSSAMLVPVLLAASFAGFDWVMSLQPTWFSSMFGIYYSAGGFVAGLALLAVVAWRAFPIVGTITPHHFHAIGRLVLAFVAFWAYAAYYQGFLIQIANKPIEVTFFLARTTGGWEYVLYALLVAHFALPFLLLLPRFVKFRPRHVAAVGALVVVAHVLDAYWLVIPSNGEPLALRWFDLSALAAVAGIVVACCAWRQRGVSLVAMGDPYLAEGIRYASST
jgi:hypothetical protein